MIINNWFSTNLKDRRNGLCDFKITINPYKFKTKSFVENCNDAATEIANAYDNLYVCYSGGLDSEFVLNTFLNIKADVTPILVRTPYNQVELEYAIRFCKSKNVKYVVRDYDNKSFVIQLHEKTHKRNLHALLGGVPLLLNDYVKENAGYLVTGYGDPFDLSEATLHQMEHYPAATIANVLEFSEWDYYPEEYDDDNPNAFFTYNLPVFYSMITEINYDIPFQRAKAELYQLEHRMKMFYAHDFEIIASKLNNIYRPNVISCEIDKNELIKYLDMFKDDAR